MYPTANVCASVCIYFSMGLVNKLHDIFDIQLWNKKNGCLVVTGSVLFPSVLTSLDFCLAYVVLMNTTEWHHLLLSGYPHTQCLHTCLCVCVRMHQLTQQVLAK